MRVTAVNAQCKQELSEDEREREGERRHTHRVPRLRVQHPIPRNHSQQIRPPSTPLLPKQHVVRKRPRHIPFYLLPPRTTSHLILEHLKHPIPLHDRRLQKPAPHRPPHAAGDTSAVREEFADLLAVRREGGRTGVFGQGDPGLFSFDAGGEGGGCGSGRARGGVRRERERFRICGRGGSWASGGRENETEFVGRKSEGTVAVGGRVAVDM
jgi:hypothetical protein